MVLDANLQHMPKSRSGISTGIDLIRHSFVCDTIANLKALNVKLLSDGDEMTVTANNSHWRFDADGTAVDVTDNLIISPTAGVGKWVRTDATVAMKIAIAFGTSDAATLLIVPAGFTLKLQELFFEVTTNWAGGSSSAIGISSADTPHSTQGDLLGGAAGTVAAELTTTIGYTGENLGINFASAPFVAVLQATDTIRFDQITSTFTSGAGFLHVIANPIVAT